LVIIITSIPKKMIRVGEEEDEKEVEMCTLGFCDFV